MRITATNAADVAKRIRLYAEHLHTWRSLYRTIARDIARAEVRWFESEGEGTWPALSEAYAQRKAILHPGKPILVAEGDLRAAATSAERLLRSSSAAAADYVIADPKAAFHGGPGPHPVMPKRDPFIPLLQVRRIVRLALTGHVRYRRGIPGPKPA
jgi:phage gpG-like protein